MTKRWMIRIISFSLSGVVIASGFAVLGFSQSRHYRTVVENTYQRAFSELVSSMSQINYTLSKGLYASSPALLTSLSSEIFRQSSAANSALSQLPFSALQLDRTSKFISQLGDYSYSLSKRVANHEPLSAKERQTLSSLAKSADKLSSDLNGLTAENNKNRLNFSDLAKSKRKLSTSEDKNITSPLTKSMKNIEKEFPEYPTLVYDGPFSEHLTKRTPALLAEKKNCTPAQALKKAASFLGIPQNALHTDGKQNGGSLPVYTFTGKRGNGEISIDITKAGCTVLEVIDSREVKSAKLTPQQAIKKASAFLTSRGIKNLKESYWTKYTNTIMVNFAYTQNGVIIYPDLIKVTICLDDGSISNFDAQGYIMSHKNRTLATPKISKSVAASKVPSGLRLLSQDIAVIPSDGEHEILTHELKCVSPEGQHYLVYLDAQTGEEVKILVLIEDENGVLTM